MIKAIAHICFSVKDLDDSEAFYRDILGCSPAFDFRKDDGGRYGTYMHIGDRGFLELFEGDPKKVEGASYMHVCLEVDEIQATVADLRARGAEVTDPTCGSDGSWQAWLHDPDGNPIELHQYTAGSRQMPWVD